MPHTFHDALIFALGVLSWDELPKEERPPRNIWLDQKAMDKHWKRVEQARKDKYGGRGDTDIDGPVSHNAALDELVK